MTTTEAVFCWFDSGRPQQKLHGPYMSAWRDAIGLKMFHTKTELLSLGYRFLSKTQIQRIQQAKPGTKIKMHYLHSTGDLYIRRLTEKEIEEVLFMMETEEALNQVNTNIKNTIPDLLQQQSMLSSKLTKMMKKLGV